MHAGAPVMVMMVTLRRGMGCTDIESFKLTLNSISIAQSKSVVDVGSRDGETTSSDRIISTESSGRVKVGGRSSLNVTEDLVSLSRGVKVGISVVLNA